MTKKPHRTSGLKKPLPAPPKAIGPKTGAPRPGTMKPRSTSAKSGRRGR